MLYITYFDMIIKYQPPFTQIMALQTFIILVLLSEYRCEYPRLYLDYVHAKGISEIDN